MLNSSHIKTTRPTKKFSERFLGPFEIIGKVSERAFRLRLPDSMSRIHPVFYVGLLENVHKSSISNRHNDPPPQVEIDGEDEYEVEEILDSRIYRRKLQYLAKWTGYGHTDEATTWEPASNLQNSPDLVSDFHRRRPDAPGP